MAQTCSKCSRANPSDAVYCYFDGFVLGGHSHNGGPVAVGAQAFAHPFVFPGGRQCHSFDELALNCQEQWGAATELLQQGYLENFFGGLGRVDLAMAAKEAAKFPNVDLGLNQLLEKLPTEVLAEPRLGLETQEINLGTLEVGAEREFRLHMENQGMRLISGSITSADAPWLALGDAAGNQKHFHFQHELDLPIHVRPDKLRANNKPLEAHLEVESSGGSFIVTVRALVPVKPFPSGALAGAKSPRQAAEKAKVNSKEAALLFENGAVAEWYKANGWTYPVQGPSASGLGAIQQFFEALGLTAPPKVAISINRIDLTGSPGEQLTYSIEIKTQEKRPVYAHATSNEPWLEVGRAKLNGRVATINLSVPSVPNKEGETLDAKLIVQSNGNQRFVVPVSLQIGNSLAFGDSAPAPVLDAPSSPVEEITSAPVIAPPTVTAKGSGEYRRRRSVKQSPSWIHLVPAALLFLALVTAVLVDRLMAPPVVPKNPDDDIHSTVAGGGGWKLSEVKDPEPRINVLFDNDTERFGVVMPKEKDPNYPDKPKRLTYDDHGKSNNTIIKIDGFEYKFGFKTPTNMWGGGRGRRLKHKEITGTNRKGAASTMVFRNDNVEVEQNVEIVPGQSGYLDTVLVYYTLKNNDQGPHKVGIRVMLDTFIGANDGVPFTIPGKKGFVNTKAEYSQKDIPDYIEAIENPNNPKNPGTVARLGLRLALPDMALDPMDKLRICRFPGQTASWGDWPVESMKPNKDEKRGDSCVVMYWPYIPMNPKETRHVAFTYGFSALDIGAGEGGSTLALSVPASVQPNSDFVVTAYVWNAKKGDKVTLTVPDGLQLADGENAEKKVDDGGARSQVFWHLRSGGDGNYTLEAATDKGKSKPKTVTVKALSIFG
ncbi:MAG TPA: hypothetical protein VMG10_20860 [Gemmataceae bacterium]|nr:hypothetical protein [Gemmataceae bacterium]